MADSGVFETVDGRAPDTEQSPPSWRLRAAVALLGVVAAAYSFVCLDYNAPPSPASVRLQGPVDAMMNTYFAQDWMLFAPTPSTDNSLLFMQVQLQTPGSATTQTITTGDIEAAIDVLPRSDRLLPTKLPGVILAFQENFAGYARSLDDIAKDDPKSKQAAARKALAETYAPAFSELQRFLSVRAATLYRGDRILAVRATFARRPIVPFSERYKVPAPSEPLETLLQTGWLPYVAGVAD